jgi:hypothetical protein
MQDILAHMSELYSHIPRHYTFLRFSGRLTAHSALKISTTNEKF